MLEPTSFSIRLTVSSLLFLVVASTSRPAFAQVVPLAESQFGPEFLDLSSGRVFVITEGSSTTIYNDVEASLVDTGYRIASTSEARSAFEAILGTPSLNVQPGIGVAPTIFNGAQFVCPVRGTPGGTCAQALYNDESTGEDAAKVGLAEFTLGGRHQFQQSSISLTDDLQDRAIAPNTVDLLDEQRVGVLLIRERIELCPTTSPRGMDLDCDQIDEKIVWRDASGVWFIRYSRSNEVSSHQWGLPGDIPIIGDYDGDGVADLVVWRPATGAWYVNTFSQGYSSRNVIVRQFGLPNDKPLKADFDGDGVLDIAVWRPAEGNYYYVRSSDSQIMVEQWGLSGDIPLMAGSRP
ncbi:MAG: VCBS repeat-containing protein [Bdellovibrionales bacterium]|nr:VCBS repeat-containing protein [Bdellovibrionales bacterium]